MRYLVWKNRLSGGLVELDTFKELENLRERLIENLCEFRVYEEEDLSRLIFDNQKTSIGLDRDDESIKIEIVYALEQSRWVQKEAAILLNISPRSMNYYCKKFDITHASWYTGKDRKKQKEKMKLAKVG